jgi:hypothetical protein
VAGMQLRAAESSKSKPRQDAESPQETHQ